MLTHCIEIFQRLRAQRFLPRSEERSTSWCHVVSSTFPDDSYSTACWLHANIASCASRRFEGDLRRRQAPEFSSRDFLRWITYTRMNAVMLWCDAVKGNHEFLGVTRAKKRDETRDDPLGGLKILSASKCSCAFWSDECILCLPYAYTHCWLF